MAADSTPEENEAIATPTDAYTTGAETPVEGPASVTPPSSDGEDDDEDYSSVRDGDDNIPEEFVCPLTLDVFTDPLMDKRGRNFERRAIVEWLNRGNDTCPLTREPLGYRSLISNVGLRTRVEQWKRENGYAMKAPEDAEMDRMKERQFMFMIEAPPNSGLEVRWNQNVEDQRIRRQGQDGDEGGPSGHLRRNARQEGEEGGTSSSSSSHRRRNARNAQVQGTGFSPATQRRRLAGLLNVVRRAPLTDN